MRSFNPHTHAGCDLLSILLRRSYVCFNPHTHAGCDLILIDLPLTWVRFNPHTHAGCDLVLFLVIVRQCRFQSTHPRRVWQSLPQFRCTEMAVSIHTPTQGVTGFNRLACRPDEVSIHTPTQGVTFWQRRISTTLSFQSTHPRRVWLLRMQIYYLIYVSIHTPTQGVTNYGVFF